MLRACCCCPSKTKPNYICCKKSYLQDITFTKYHIDKILYFKISYLQDMISTRYYIYYKVSHFQDILLTKYQIFMISFTDLKELRNIEENSRLLKNHSVILRQCLWFFVILYSIYCRKASRLGNVSGKHTKLKKLMLHVFPSWIFCWL